MPVLARVDWALRQVEMGRKLHVVIGQAADTTKTKIKLVLDKPQSGTLAEISASAVTTTLRMIREWVLSSVATDRGHKHSSGQSIVHIWLSLVPAPPPPPLPSAVAEAQDGAEDCSSDAVPAGHVAAMIACSTNPLIKLCHFIFNSN